MPEPSSGLGLQLWVGRLTAPLWIPLATAVMRLRYGWRIEGAGELRAAYRRICSEARGPILVCANHLTMADSFVVAWALGSPLFYLRHPSRLPWNTPERTNFATTWWSRLAIYLMKCVPIERGADRAAVAGTLERLVALLRRGESVLIFPEGGRSRSGRVELESAAWGVGRVARAVPGCRVVCVYLRGERQETWADLPVRGERFRGAVSELEPKSERGGVRGSLQVAQQIVARLREMEERHFARRREAGGARVGG